ncbi:helix-turn-helix domain-containing protein [uncultured Pseudokineococcus sp.]|uniref:helix-turn-helix domain-containing protein n=1 Tax=uncultured Pseudokineococcus sp. TaxID=1642928 RepID=UPI0026129DCE|nr:helix-turn-helix domain-containing protein [uncultured Pseudokineococcus sp.]
MSTPPPEPPPPRRFLTVTQVAEELNVSVAQVYALLRDRSLAAIKVGGRGQWRIERDRLEDYIARAYADAAASPVEAVDEDDQPTS